MKYRKNILWCCCGLLAMATGLCGFAQNTQIEVYTDTLEIKIGEQLNYEIQVATDSLTLVNFPQGQTFLPIEVIETYDTDTIKRNARYYFVKKYGLTQFDSGAYTLPPQKIGLDGVVFYTDSIKIKVHDVLVDTLKQKMYDIKPIELVEKSGNSFWLNLLLALLFLGLLGAGAYYYFVVKGKRITLKKKPSLPPYERALEELKKLENSRYLIQSEYKQYYSELTAIVRSYLEEDAHISALESTTEELILKMEMRRDAGDLNLKEETIGQFKKVLQTADLVKFARSKPDKTLAEKDRTVVIDVVKKTKEALPEPTLEELEQDEEFLKEKTKTKKKRRIIIAAASLMALILLTGVVTGFIYGFSYVKDVVLGHPSRELLHTEWVRSEYGYPPLGLETPKVLLRQDPPQMPPELAEVLKEQYIFGYGSMTGQFSVVAGITTLNSENDADINLALEGALRTFENAGAKNILTKKEEILTKNGIRGLKAYGTASVLEGNSKNYTKGNYAMVFFGGNGFIQQLVITWRENDIYAAEISDRIMQSLEPKTGS